MIKWLLFIMLLTNVSQATKPSAPLKPQIKRADYILSATAINSCSYCNVKNKATFIISKILKGNIVENNITVIAPSLSFDMNVKYILFLQKKDNKFYWINGNSSRLVATQKNIKSVKNLLSIKE